MERGRRESFHIAQGNLLIPAIPSLLWTMLFHVAAARVARWAVSHPTANGGMQNGSSVGILYTMHTRFCTFGSDLACSVGAY